MKVVMHNSLSLLTILIPYNIFIFSLNTSRREHHSLINCAFTTPLADIALFPSSSTTSGKSKPVSRIQKTSYALAMVISILI